MLDLVKTAVADERAEGGGPSDVEAGETVEEAELENVGADEAPERAGDSGGDGEAGAARLMLLQKEVGEGIYLRDVTGERGERVVKQIAAQGRDRAVALHLFVHELIAAPTGAGAVDEA